MNADMVGLVQLNMSYYSYWNQSMTTDIFVSFNSSCLVQHQWLFLSSCLVMFVSFCLEFLVAVVLLSSKHGIYVV